MAYRYMTEVRDSRGKLKEVRYKVPGLMGWVAKRVYMAQESEDATCDDDCEGCGECATRFIEIGLRVMTECGERSFFVARGTQKISSSFRDETDTAGVTITRLKEMHPTHTWIVERLAPLFDYSLKPRAKRTAVNVRKLNSERRQHEVCAYVAPLTKQVNQAKAKLREQRCISQAHAVAQYKHFARKGINAAITCDGGTYVVKWEDNAC